MSLGRNAHWRVAKVALEMARATWEHLATVKNAFYKAHPDRERWARAHQAKFLGFARRAMVDSLKLNTLSEDHKEEIIESLALDQALMAKASPRQQLRLN